MWLQQRSCETPLRLIERNHHRTRSQFEDLLSGPIVMDQPFHHHLIDGLYHLDPLRLQQPQ